MRTEFVGLFYISRNECFHKGIKLSVAMLKKIVKLLKRTVAGPVWKNFEYFDERWKRRIGQLASLIEDEKVVLDLGCGRMWLKEMLPEDINYIGCDYTNRGPDSLICDFNKKEFPNVKADACFVSGVLEYIDDVDWFLRKISACCNSLIISYCTTDYNPDMTVRKSLNWVNHFTFSELKDKIESKGFVLYKKGKTTDNNELMKFKAAPINGN